jgi:hypothetical protein
MVIQVQKAAQEAEVHPQDFCDTGANVFAVSKPIRSTEARLISSASCRKGVNIV